MIHTGASKAKSGAAAAATSNPRQALETEATPAASDKTKMTMSGLQGGDADSSGKEPAGPAMHAMHAAGSLAPCGKLCCHVPM